jgi:hypothetical protein
MMDGPLMHDGSVSGKEKAAVIKELLNMDMKEPLMEKLGKQCKAALIRETQDEWELVVPHNLLDQLEYSERVVARFQRHATMPITHRWQQVPTGIWEVWRDEVDVSEFIPDLNLSWLP